MKRISLSFLFAFVISLLFVIPSFAMLHGDADLDGVLTTADARLALRMAVGLEEPPLYNADASGDKRVTAEDARLILRTVVGLDNIDNNHIYLSDNTCIICGFDKNAPVPPREPLKAEENELTYGITVTELTSVLGDYEREYENFSGMKAYTFIFPDGLVMALSKDEKICAYYVNGCSARFNNIGIGSVPEEKVYYFSDGSKAEYFTDGNDGGRVYAMLCTAPDTGITADIDSKEFFENTSKQIFNMTNAFRSQYGLKAFIWHSAASEVSAMHSKDMADNNYFAHEDLKGGQAWDRAVAYGINYYMYGENIAAGNILPWYTTDQWVNSAPHRDSMLDDFIYLGIGGAFNPLSTFNYYWTQNFLSQ